MSEIIGSYVQVINGYCEGKVGVVLEYNDDEKSIIFEYLENKKGMQRAVIKLENVVQLYSDEIKISDLNPKKDYQFLNDSEISQKSVFPSNSSQDKNKSPRSSYIPDKIQGIKHQSFTPDFFTNNIHDAFDENNLLALKMIHNGTKVYVASHYYNGIGVFMGHADRNFVKVLVDGNDSNYDGTQLLTVSSNKVSLFFPSSSLNVQISQQISQASSSAIPSSSSSSSSSSSALFSSSSFPSPPPDHHYELFALNPKNNSEDKFLGKRKELETPSHKIWLNLIYIFSE